MNFPISLIKLTGFQCKIERAIVKYLPFLIVASLLLSACASKSQTPTVQPVLPIKETPEIQKTQTPQLDSITPTPTANPAAH